MIRTPATEEGVPWWLWPNLLSLDAPVVAIVWHRLVAQAVAPIPWAVTLVLALAVWLAYAADRWLDAERGSRPSLRHRFAARHSRPVLLAWSLVFALTVLYSVWRLPLEHLRSGLLLAAAVLARLLASHVDALASAKNILTAAVFTAGVWWPLNLTPDAGWFALLCWANCRAIDTWETGKPSGALLAGLAALAVTAFAWSRMAAAPLAAAVALAAALMALLAASRLSVPARRALVDLCLLTPLLWYGR